MRTATLYNFLLEANLMASIAILLMLPIRRFLRPQLGSRTIRFLWLLVALRLLCPLVLPNPAINEIRSPFALDEAIRPIAGQIKVRLTDAAQDLHQSAANGSVQERILDDFVDASYNGMLALRGMQVYVMGAALAAGWFVLCNARFRLRLRQGRIEPISGQLMEQYQALCRRMNVRPLPVYFTDPLPSACLVGVWKPYIALPLTASPSRAVEVLRHELCHYRGHDHWWGAIRLACCVLHWFNPLVWLAAFLSRTDSELACDERVTDGMDARQRRAYASVLVLAAARRDAPGTGVLATGMTMAGSRLKMRVASIVGGAHARRGLAAMAVLLACMALVGAFATGEYLPVPAIPAAPQVPHPGTLSDEAAAVAYAQTLWQSADLNQSTAGFAFTASPLDGGGWTVLGSDGESELALSVDGEGQVVSLRNGAVARGRDLAIACVPPDHHDSGWYARLSAYLMDFTGQVEPSAAENAGSIKYLGEGMNPDGRRYLTAWRLSGDGQPLRQLDVQTEPVFRIILYGNPFSGI